MPKSSPAKLKYQAAYNKRPEETAKGVERRRTRRQMISQGKVAIGDGKDVSHKTAMDNGGKSHKSNVKVESSSANRGWREGQSGYRVPNKK